jgi:hypothetical protein
MDEKERIEVYEPPEIVEVGSVASLTGVDGSPDQDDGSAGDG